MRGPLGGLIKRVWIPVVLIVVLAVSGLLVLRLHRLFASTDLNAEAVDLAARIAANFESLF